MLQSIHEIDKCAVCTKTHNLWDDPEMVFLMALRGGPTAHKYTGGHALPTFDESAMSALTPCAVHAGKGGKATLYKRAASTIDKLTAPGPCTFNLLGATQAFQQLHAKHNGGAELVPPCLNLWKLAHEEMKKEEKEKGVVTRGMPFIGESIRIEVVHTAGDYTKHHLRYATSRGTMQIRCMCRV